MGLHIRHTDCDRLDLDTVLDVGSTGIVRVLVVKHALTAEGVDEGRSTCGKEVICQYFLGATVFEVICDDGSNTSVVAIDPTDTTDSQRAIVVVESRGWWC